MKLEALDIFCCPSCKSEDLQAISRQSDGSEIVSGSLVCRNCSESYLITRRIPRFVTGENYLRSFGFQWNRYSKTQLDSYTGRPISRQRLFDVTGWATEMSGQRILEAGSGAGRFTEVLLDTGATVFSFDYSSAVEANWQNNGHNSKLNLFQADIYRIPLRLRSFDKVICIGVLQHTPDPEIALKQLAKYVRPGGELVVDSYNKCFSSLFHWKYLLRPLTKRMHHATLYKVIVSAVPPLLPIAGTLRKYGGRAGVRILPILDYSHLGLPQNVATQWAILDTFDMYSPAYDHPVSMRTLERWLREANLVNISVCAAPNGCAARARRPVDSEAE